MLGTPRADRVIELLTIASPGWRLGGVPEGKQSFEGRGFL
jgi:hypothetical protein